MAKIKDYKGRSFRRYKSNDGTIRIVIILPNGKEGATAKSVKEAHEIIDGSKK